MTTRAGPFARSFENLTDLPEAFREQFLQPPDCGYQVSLEGTMRRVWHRPFWLRPLLSALARVQMLFPEEGADIPARLALTCVRRGNHVVQVWDRAFTFPRVTRRFYAEVTRDRRSGAVVERFAFRGCLELRWTVTFEPPDTLRITGDRWRFRLGGLGVPMPALFCGAVHAVQRASQSADPSIDMTLVCRHPLLGDVFGYEGSFTVRREPAA